MTTAAEKKNPPACNPFFCCVLATKMCQRTLAWRCWDVGLWLCCYFWCLALASEQPHNTTIIRKACSRKSQGERWFRIQAIFSQLNVAPLRGGLALIYPDAAWASVEPKMHLIKFTMAISFFSRINGWICVRFYSISDLLFDSGLSRRVGRNTDVNQLNEGNECTLQRLRELMSKRDLSRNLCSNSDWTTIISTSATETSVSLIQIHHHIKSSFVSSATFDLTWILTACLEVIIWIFWVLTYLLLDTRLPLLMRCMWVSGCWSSLSEGNFSPSGTRRPGISINLWLIHYSN